MNNTEQLRKFKKFVEERDLSGVSKDKTAMRKLLIREGIYNKDGTISENYGGVKAKAVSGR
jgi:hypothetical protein